jgi:hypothetical protein
MVSKGKLPKKREKEPEENHQRGFMASSEHLHSKTKKE